MSPGTPTFPASSISFVSGEREAVLIEALLTFDEAKRAASWIRSKGKKLTTIYITDARLAWIASIDKIAALKPSLVVAGHKAQATRDDDLDEVIGGSKQLHRRLRRGDGGAPRRPWKPILTVERGDRSFPRSYASMSDSARIRTCEALARAPISRSPSR